MLPLLTTSDHINPCLAGSVTGGGYIPEDARSHLSAMSAHHHGRDAKSRSRSIGDLTGKAYNMSGPGFGLGLSRQGE